MEKIELDMEDVAMNIGRLNIQVMILEKQNKKLREELLKLSSAMNQSKGEQK